MISYLPDIIAGFFYVIVKTSEEGENIRKREMP